ncbi:MAG: hypothetical protein JRJ49_07015 [Deltaproteobacteria bacterium]|nr:hypothetical protein [Deltaproteobacteria bacterium]
MTKYQRAMQIWTLLVLAAKEGKIYTYSDISDILKSGIPLGVAKYLNSIRSYCDEKGYPPLDVLVIQKKADRPGNKYQPRKTVAQDRADVYAYKHKWFAIEPPQISDFENAMKKK